MIHKNGANDNLIGAGPQRQAFAPRDLDTANLERLDHAEWLDDFSKILSLQTGVAMTPKREGVITRLHWAAQYVLLLKRMVSKNLERIATLEAELKQAREGLTRQDEEGR